MPKNERAKRDASVVKSLYTKVRPQIEERLRDFERVGRDATDEELFAELAFCLLTPQSKARYCWAAVCRLADGKLLLCGQPGRISARLAGVRFHNNKARYVAEAQRLFTVRGNLDVRSSIERDRDPKELREWLVANVNGLGHKEASHFLRNVGRGEGLAILDRHILRNMVALGALDEVPKALPAKRYVEVEGAFLDLARKLGIPPGHLDLLLWYMEAGEVFK
jgi:N-glycosylase/DNA lyase